MKYIYSYLPLKKIDSIDVLFDVICIKLSSTILKKNNKKVGIYSNNEFINLLKYYNVDLDFYVDIEEEINHMFDHIFFALPKIYASSIQTEPFILLDIDMILFDSFNFDEYENKSIFFHYPESITFLTSNQVFSEKFRVDEDILKYQSSYDSYFNWKNTYLDQYYMLCDISTKITNEKFFSPTVAYNCAMYGGVDWLTLSEVNRNIYNFIKENHIRIKEEINYPMTVLEQQLVVAQLVNYGYLTNEMDFLTKWNEFTIIESEKEIRVNYDNLNFVFEWGKKYEDICDPQFLILVEHQFNGHLHLTRSKETTGVKNLIYNMLKYYDVDYINWFENNRTKELDFQQKIY
jgi:hypothetical protein